MNKIIFIALGFIASSLPAFATELKVGDDAPSFTTKTDAGADFDLQSRKGKWTVLYFYPKASTPGCTKQACGFRDQIEKIRAQGADVFGVSVDTIEAQAKFHKEQKLNFTLLADSDAKIVALYGSKMPVVSLSKRWTFIIDPQLRIRNIDKTVDPVLDAKKVSETIEAFKKTAQSKSS